MWFKVDDKFHSHPKVCGVSLAAVGLWAKAGSWCGDHLTDGHVPRGAVLALGGSPELAAELVDAGLWEVTERGWRFHEWLDHQPPAERVRQKQDEARERMRRVRAERRSPPVRANTPRTDGEHTAKFARSSPNPDPDPVKISERELNPFSADAAPTRTREDFGGSRVLKLPVQLPDHVRASAAAGWLSQATGHEAYSTNPAGRHYQALLELAGKTEAEKAEAARVLKVEGQKPEAFRWLTPTHVVDNWRLYKNGEAPGKRAPLAAAKPESSELSQLREQWNLLRKQEEECLFFEDDKKQRIAQRRKEIGEKIRALGGWANAKPA